MNTKNKIKIQADGVIVLMKINNQEDLDILRMIFDKIIKKQEELLKDEN